MMVGGESWSSESECASVRESECVWTCWCVCEHVWTGEDLDMSVSVLYSAVVEDVD